MSPDQFDLWLDGAGFEELDEPAPEDGMTADGGSTDGDDPWGSMALAPTPLTDAQRAFVDDTSPGLGATLATGTLLATHPLDDVDPDEVARADEDVIDFDDDR